jgi:hypothetical protein
MKVTELFERTYGKGEIGYDAQNKHPYGRTSDFLDAIGADDDVVAKAVNKAKELKSYKDLMDIGSKDISTSAEAKNGTFSFEKLNSRPPKGVKWHGGKTRRMGAERYIVYATGLIRSQADDAPTRLKSPKPALKHGDPVASLVKTYDQAFKEVLEKQLKRIEYVGAVT